MRFAASRVGGATEIDERGGGRGLENLPASSDLVADVTAQLMDLLAAVVEAAVDASVEPILYAPQPLPQLQVRVLGKANVTSVLADGARFLRTRGHRIQRGRRAAAGVGFALL